MFFKIRKSLLECVDVIILSASSCQSMKHGLLWAIKREECFNMNHIAGLLMKNIKIFLRFREASDQINIRSGLIHFGNKFTHDYLGTDKFASCDIGLYLVIIFSSFSQNLWTIDCTPSEFLFKFRKLGSLSRRDSAWKE